MTTAVNRLRVTPFIFSFPFFGPVSAAVQPSCKRPQDRMTRPATPRGALLIARPATRRGQATFAVTFLICGLKPTKSHFVKSHFVNGLLTVDP